MKNIPVLFCVLIFGSTGLLAQDLRLSGTFNTGVMVTIPETGETDVRLETDDGFGPVSARLRLYGTLEKPYWGIQFRLQTDLTTEWQYGFRPEEQFAFVWANFFQDRMRIYAGKLAWGLWYTPFEESWSLDAQTGIRFEFKPIHGLSFGSTLKIPPRDMPDLGKFTVKRMFNEAVVGARYAARLFTVVGAFAFDGWDNYRNDEQVAIFGFEYRGIPNLWIGFESRYQNITSGEMEYNLVERFGFPINSLTYGFLRIYQDGKMGTEGIDFRINPEANTRITGRLLIAAEAEFAFNTADAGNTWWVGIKPKFLLRLREGCNLTGHYYGRFNNGGYSAFNIGFEFFY